MISLWNEITIMSVRDVLEVLVFVLLASMACLLKMSATSLASVDFYFTSYVLDVQASKWQISLITNP